MLLAAPFLGALLAAPARAEPRPVSVYETGGTPRVLVYTRTVGFRHDSIPTAIEVLKEQQQTYGLSFDFTEDPNMFVDNTLKTYDGIMFISTTEEVLNWDQQGALERWLQSGGNFMGVHAASACLYHDESYHGALGAYFNYHPYFQPATFTRINNDHPSTAHLPDRWTYPEEVYFFTQDPRDAGATVVLTVDESSFQNPNGDPSASQPHPIAWYMESPKSAQPLQKGAPKTGRSFYTALGHSSETWRDETFIQHALNGLTWALDGASTKAYNVGIIGNQSVWVPPKPKTTALPSPTQTQPVAGGLANESQKNSAGRAVAPFAGVAGVAALFLGACTAAFL